QGGERAEDDAERQEERMLAPERCYGRGSGSGPESHGDERHGEDGQVHEQDDHEVAEEPAQGLDREAEVDQVPVTERQPRRDRAEHERAGEEGERIEQGRRGEDGSQTTEARAHAERDQPESERDGVGARALPAGVAPEGGEVDRGGHGEDRPHADLAQAGGVRLTRAQDERRLASDEEHRASDEDGRGRLVEATLEHREGRHGEADQTTDRELTEDEEEAVAEIGHRPLLDDGAGDDKRRGAARRPPRGALYSATISTRRFSARPSAVLLLATGRDFPYPRVVIRLALMPFCTMRSRTVSARRSDSFWL